MQLIMEESAWRVTHSSTSVPSQGAPSALAQVVFSTVTWTWPVWSSAASTLTGSSDSAMISASSREMTLFFISFFLSFFYLCKCRSNHTLFVIANHRPMSLVWQSVISHIPLPLFPVPPGRVLYSTARVSGKRKERQIAQNFSGKRDGKGLPSSPAPAA